MRTISNGQPCGLPWYVAMLIMALTECYSLGLPISIRRFHESDMIRLLLVGYLFLELRTGERDVKCVFAGVSCLNGLFAIAAGWALNDALWSVLGLGSLGAAILTSIALTGKYTADEPRLRQLSVSSCTSRSRSLRR